MQTSEEKINAVSKSFPFLSIQEEIPQRRFVANFSVSGWQFLIGWNPHLIPPWVLSSPTSQKCLHALSMGILKLAVFSTELKSWCQSFHPDFQMESLFFYENKCSDTIIRTQGSCWLEAGFCISCWSPGGSAICFIGCGDYCGGVNGEDPCRTEQKYFWVFG